MHIIVLAAHGDITAYDATIVNAKEILSWQKIPEEVIQFAANRPARYTTYETIASVVQKILTGAEDALAFKSKFDETRTIVATREAKQEIVMYLFDRGISPDSFSSYLLQSDAPAHKDLQCLAYFRDMPVVDEWVTTTTNKYSFIMEDRWDADTPDIRKVRYIINFVNDLTHRDEKYTVLKVAETC